jgi:hypothetical protein
MLARKSDDTRLFRDQTIVWFSSIVMTSGPADESCVWPPSYSSSADSNARPEYDGLVLTAEGRQSIYWSGGTTKSSGSETPVAWFGQ